MLLTLILPLSGLKSFFVELLSTFCCGFGSSLGGKVLNAVVSPKLTESGGLLIRLTFSNTYLPRPLLLFSPLPRK